WCPNLIFWAARIWPLRSTMARVERVEEMKTASIGAVGVATGLAWRVLYAVFTEHDGHSFTQCAFYLDIRCQWVLVPAPAKLLILVGFVLAVYGFAVAIKHARNNIRTSN